MERRSCRLLCGTPVSPIPPPTALSNNPCPDAGAIPRIFPCPSITGPCP